MVCNNILDAIGNTPIIRLSRMADPESAEILVKFEGLNVGGSIKTRTAYNMIKDAEARGVILMCAHAMGVKIFEYTPLQVKQAVVGYGRAEKKQVITMVTRLLGLEKPPRPDDTADALAIAVCHAHSGASRLAQYYNQN